MNKEDYKRASKIQIELMWEKSRLKDIQAIQAIDAYDIITLDNRKSKLSASYATLGFKSKDHLLETIKANTEKRIAELEKQFEEI